MFFCIWFFFFFVAVFCLAACIHLAVAFRILVLTRSFDLMLDLLFVQCLPLGF